VTPRLSTLLLMLCVLAACVSNPVLRVEAPSPPCGVSPPGHTIRWIRAVAPGEAADSTRWCAGVGNAVFLEGDRVTTDAAPPLTFISWNTHIGGGDIGRLIGDARAGRLTGTPVSNLVLLLQEVYRHDDSVPFIPPAHARVAARQAPSPPDAARRGIESAARDAGLSLLYVPSMRNGAAAEDRGNAILSSIALEHAEAIELPLERQRRVAIAADILVRNASTRTTLRIVSTHFTNMVAHHLWALSEPGRVRQARALASALDDGRPTVVGGDLNSWFGYRDGAFRELARVLPAAHPRDRRATFGPMRLDHVLARLPAGWHITVRRAESRYGSDHYPLVAIIE
jgi:endonuclease/exonuclease/phosphatase family metal-dependent hydrolase